MGDMHEQDCLLCYHSIQPHHLRISTASQAGLACNHIKNNGFIDAAQEVVCYIAFLAVQELS